MNTVNDAPVNLVPAGQSTVQDQPLLLSTANANPISVSDVDARSGILQVMLSATNGTLTLSTVSGLTFSAGDGTADSTMTFRGQLSAMNSALNGLRFNPTAGFSGSASVAIATNDQGNSGSGGALSDNDTVAITVQANALNADINGDGVVNAQDRNAAGKQQGTQLAASLPLDD